MSLNVNANVARLAAKLNANPDFRELLVELKLSVATMYHDSIETPPEMRVVATSVVRGARDLVHALDAVAHNTVPPKHPKPSLHVGNPTPKPAAAPAASGKDII